MVLPINSWLLVCKYFLTAVHVILWSEVVSKSYRQERFCHDKSRGATRFVDVHKLLDQKNTVTILKARELTWFINFLNICFLVCIPSRSIFCVYYVYFREHLFKGFTCIWIPICYDACFINSHSKRESELSLNCTRKLTKNVLVQLPDSIIFIESTLGEVNYKSRKVFVHNIFFRLKVTDKEGKLRILFP